MEEIIISARNEVAFINKDLQRATNKINKIGDTVRKCAYATAAIIAEVDAKESYREDGFETVHDWTTKTFGFKKSASYNLLKIGKEYTQPILNEKGNVIGYKSNLVDSDEDFTVSQVTKMLPAGHSVAQDLVNENQITVDMSCQEIEKVIKAATAEPEEAEESAETVESEETTEEAEVMENAPVFILVSDSNGNWYNVPEDVLNQYKTEMPTPENI